MLLALRFNAMHGCSSFHASVLLLAALVALPSLAAGQPWGDCNVSGSAGNYSADSTYEKNLQNLVELLRANSSASSTLSASGAYGTAPDAVYGLMLCRGDVSATDCYDCGTSVLKDVAAECNRGMDVALCYNKCYVRLSDTNFLASTNNSGLVRHRSIESINSSDVTGYNSAVTNLLSATIQYAVENSSSRLFATGAWAGPDPGFPHIYSMAQCTPGLSPTLCQSCLQELLARWWDWDGMQLETGARIVGTQCNLRSEAQPEPFYTGGVMLQLPIQAPAPAYQTGGTTQTRRLENIHQQEQSSLEPSGNGTNGSAETPTPGPPGLSTGTPGPMADSPGPMPDPNPSTDGTTQTPPGENIPHQHQSSSEPSDIEDTITSAATQTQGGDVANLLQLNSTSAAIVIGVQILQWVIYIWFAVSWCMWKRADTSFVKKAGLAEFRRFEYRDIKESTCRFSSDNRIGEGAFGVVYKGTLKTDEVAVKQITKSVMGEVDDFLGELKASGRTSHKNIVRLKGWCCKMKWKFFRFILCRQQYETDLFLVYELVPNHNLHYHLNPDTPEQRMLPWETRYKIVKGIGSGLCYLHHECDPYILHRDIKPCNILLDDDFNPKIADFGLSRIASTNNTIALTRAVGTEKYMDPLNMKHGNVEFTRTSDVYSFGVVLLEIACPHKNKDQVREMYRRSGPDQLLEDTADDKLNGAFDRMQMMQVVILGLWCCFPEDALRPSMEDAIKFLWNDAPLLKKGIWTLKHGKEFPDDEPIIQNEDGGNTYSMRSPDVQDQPFIPMYERSV